MKIRRSTTYADKVPLDMTPMIDCVFQLLIFFIMSLKIVAPEGDFNVAMPRPAISEDPPRDEPPRRLIQLEADAEGNLTDIRYEGRSFGSDWRGLQRELIQFVGDETGPDSARARTQVEFDVPYHLQYTHVVHGLNYVTSQAVDGQVVKLIENVKFTPKQPKSAG